MHWSLHHVICDLKVITLSPDEKAVEAFQTAPQVRMQPASSSATDIYEAFLVGQMVNRLCNFSAKGIMLFIHVILSHYLIVIFYVSLKCVV